MNNMKNTFTYLQETSEDATTYHLTEAAVAEQELTNHGELKKWQVKFGD